MMQLYEPREVSSSSELEEESTTPSMQGEGSISVSDDEGWQACLSRRRCRRPKWTREEEMILVEAHCSLGNAWVAIAECLSGRSPSEVKNIWHSTLRARKLQTRSVLRAYVVALKDRGDKPSARQQAMQAAQLFHNELASKDASTPSNKPGKVHRRTELQRPSHLPKLQHREQHPRQQKQQKQQDKLFDHIDVTSALCRLTQVSSPGLSEQQDASNEVCASAGGGGSAASPEPGPLLSGGAVHLPGHRSSLGSDWSCISPGAIETSWPSVGITTTATSEAPLTAASLRSFSPLVHAGAIATTAVFSAGRTNARAIVTTAITTPHTHTASISRSFGSSLLGMHAPLIGVTQPSGVKLPTAFAATDSATPTAAAVFDLNSSCYAATATAAQAAFIGSSGVCVSGMDSIGDSCRLWREAGSRELAGLSGPHCAMPRMAQTKSKAVAIDVVGSYPRVSTTITAQVRSSLPSVSSPYTGDLGLHHGPVFPAVTDAGLTTTRGLNGLTDCQEAAVSGCGDMGMRTLGLHGMTDWELLACLEV